MLRLIILAGLRIEAGSTPAFPNNTIQGSSMVEQLAVNERVGGSSPPPGAKKRS